MNKFHLEAIIQFSHQKEFKDNFISRPYGRGSKCGCLEESIEKPPYTKEQFGTASEKVLNTLRNTLRMWKSNDIQDRFTVFSMYFDSKPIYDKKTGFGTSTLSSPIKVFDVLRSSETNIVEMPIYEIGSGI